MGPVRFAAKIRRGIAQATNARFPPWGAFRHHRLTAGRGLPVLRQDGLARRRQPGTFNGTGAGDQACAGERLARSRDASSRLVMAATNSMSSASHSG